MPECCIKFSFKPHLTIHKWDCNDTIIPGICQFWKELLMLSVSDQWAPLRKCRERTLSKALVRIIFQLKKGLFWISIFSPGVSATPEVRGLLHIKWRLQVLHVKMEGAPVVAFQVGGTDMLPSGTPGLTRQWSGCVKLELQSRGSQGFSSRVRTAKLTV